MAGISCPSCGGKMIFDIPNQNLKCHYCDNRIEVNDYNTNNKAEEHKDVYSTLVFTCRNCGAELLAPDEQTVAYCSYCGSESMLDGKYEDVLRPKKIVPFQKSKKQAKNEYEKALKGKFYIPKEFKDSSFLEEFRGIYLPYYSYEAVIPEKNIQLTGKKKYTRGGYDYNEEYAIEADIGGTAKGIKYDASAAFDDTIANEIAPFKQKDEKNFSDAYLAGFYADKATTDVDNYLEYATEDALDEVYKDIEKRTGGVDVNNDKKLEEKKEEISIESFNCNVTMYPVWFLTWRHKNRVAYSVMNGQTGKIAMDIPVDKKKFFLISAAIAVVVFVLLSILPVFILPRMMAVIAAIILCVSGIALRKEVKRIYEKENHLYDYGDSSHAVKKKRIKLETDSGRKNKGKKKSSGGSGCTIALGLYFLFLFGAGIVSLLISLVNGINAGSADGYFMGAALIVQGITSFFIIRYAVALDKKSAIVPALFSALAVLFGFAAAVMNPVHDYWYYGSALACLVGLVLNSLSAINYFNYLTTRPVPNFFTREGAENE